MSPEPSSATRSTGRRGLAIFGTVVALVLAVIVVNGIWDRNSSAARLKESTDAQAAPTVSVVTPSDGLNNSHLGLPGRLEAYYRAPIYARVSGFVKAWYADIGTPVKAGQLLAEIEAPDLDQQLEQAKGALASAQAAEALAKVTAQRWQALGVTNAVAKQSVDEKLGDLGVKEANTKAAQAVVDRLQVLSEFKRVTAPFDGIVTARNTDVGALINADSSAGLALFVVSDVKKLRLTIAVPQIYVPAVKINSKVEIRVPEHPRRVYSGLVEASSRAVDAASGTTRMQVVVDNSSGDLMPGAFANTRIEFPQALKVLTIPSGALIFDEKGLRVATVDANSKAVLKSVTIARDLGQVVEISAGLSLDDRVIESPPDGIATGDPVRVVKVSQAELKKR
ncbi:RND family efflux transporter, MFP subunit [Enhydrobacter aerosaccus]|uniref:RND family efflux transporter, MFP subunit n=1 Tax=Enhydrobacter aerosaccus TaxID=225324 RepID=A0A1T4RY52_9HYPH|nr:efflux RND transporter periplasmic adaptor subunit [Enhydrobacter aerosaccus]SKA20847.1 RND family efflux transporter, MFP subunit [Enhydrobacter aerosaccus]